MGNQVSNYCGQDLGSGKAFVARGVGQLWLNQIPVSFRYVCSKKIKKHWPSGYSTRSDHWIYYVTLHYVNYILLDICRRIVPHADHVEVVVYSQFFMPIYITDSIQCSINEQTAAYL